MVFLKAPFVWFNHDDGEHTPRQGLLGKFYHKRMEPSWLRRMTDARKENSSRFIVYTAEYFCQILADPLSLKKDYSIRRKPR